MKYHGILEGKAQTQEGLGEGLEQLCSITKQASCPDQQHTVARDGHMLVSGLDLFPHSCICKNRTIEKHNSSLPHTIGSIHCCRHWKKCPTHLYGLHTVLYNANNELLCSLPKKEEGQCLLNILLSR